MTFSGYFPNIISKPEYTMTPIPKMSNLKTESLNIYIH